MESATAIQPFRISIDDVFQFKDGSTVFIGKMVGGGNVITPSNAELLVNDVSLGRLRLEGERMPGPRTRDKRIVFTYDKVDVDRLRRGAGVIQYPAKE